MYVLAAAAVGEAVLLTWHRHQFPRIWNCFSQDIQPLPFFTAWKEDARRDGEGGPIGVSNLGGWEVALRCVLLVCVAFVRCLQLGRPSMALHEVPN